MRIQILGSIAALTVGALAGCSLPPAQTPHPSTLPGGTAEVTIDDQRMPTSYAVDCVRIQSTTTISIGYGASRLVAVVDKSDQAVSVNINNLGGFTGSYLKELNKPAEIQMVDATITITGTADGFNTDNPSKRTSTAFILKSNC
jgi:hypothetical protein